MVKDGKFSDMDSPPDIPTFCSGTKKPRKESLGDAITGAATTFVKALVLHHRHPMLKPRHLLQLVEYHQQKQ